MPPPRSRPGHSRRAQYGLFFGYVAAVTGMLVAALLLVASVLDPRGYNAIATAATDVTAPLQGGGRGVGRALQDAVDGIAAYVEAGSKNRLLTRELADSRTRLIAAAATERQNRELRALLGISAARPDPVAAARIVGSTPVGGRRFATIDAGASSGVRPGQPVLAAPGLVGRVEAVGQWSARVQLLTDGGNVVPVRRATDGLAGIATGTGDGAIDVRPLVSGANPFRQGDVIVTSGVGGVYAPGIPIGTVSRLTPDGALVRPRADPSAIDFALVYPLYLQPLPPPPPPPAD
ncbi:rod shape-determining protein MreC [Sphingomonas jejuensis]|uniref:Cell shape-determining protein MreC n=1 Tax=Sphingomonas jejuensis TaxID=904715 RepID=A0ABX0XIQ6_9SPHN|nr:rod shape-determining protein MreC [Sphingomonas jejuensis]NJC33228.1 rod shape-determining protein MreC [Sphingomonas jejuensis]